jgi:predicted DNA-binding transcriptional regulator YafY
MKNSRLFEILYLLMERRELTASWLAHKLEVSQRTIYRDLDALSASGIPVYCQKGKGGGIRLMEQFQMDRSLIDEKEQEELLTALKSLQTIKAIDNSGLLSRLSVLFQKKPTDWLEVDFGSWDGHAKEQQYFERCKEAILTCRRLHFTYYNSSSQESSRTVEPLCLYYKGGGWYLKAYCLLKEDYRMFRLNRILDLTVLDETFSPGRIHEANFPKEYMDSSYSPPTIPFTLLFSPMAAYRVMDAFLPEEIETQENGSFLVHTSYPPGQWILGFLMSFGKDVQVLEPEWMRKELEREAVAVARLYAPSYQAQEP